MVETAIMLFGRYGYKRVSTRDIAAGAGVTPPALQYYFDGKEGLYFACVDRVTSKITRRISPVLQQCSKTLDTSIAIEDLVAAICAIQDCLIDAFYTEDEGPRILRLIDEEDDQAETRDARNLMRDRVNLPIFRVVAPLIGRIIGTQPDDLVTGLHAFTIFGQVMTFHQDRKRLADAIGWRDPDPEAINLLKSLLKRQTSLILHGLAQSAGST